MRGFLYFLRNLILLALIAFGIWSYQNNPRVRLATNDSVATLRQRVNQLLTTGNFNAPNLRESQPTSNAVNQNKETKSLVGQTKAGEHTWPHAHATVYLDLTQDHQLDHAAIQALNAWNHTGAFTFIQTTDKDQAKIIIKTMDDNTTRAAGQTATTYNPVNGHLIEATIELNRYYLQNSWFGYNQNRIVNTVEHELGHAIGLNHNQGVSVMYPAGSLYTIQPVDVRNVRKLYQHK